MKEETEVQELQNKIIDVFENRVASFVGCDFGVAVSSGTNAIFLSLQYLKSIGEITLGLNIKIPKRTYVSVPMSIINAGFKVAFLDWKWSGIYQLVPTRIWDSTTRFKKGMYIKGSLQCLSFQYRKHLKLGRGGMILTDDEQAYKWLKQARHNGKHSNVSRWNDEYETIGWDMYLKPVDALLGLTLLKMIPFDNEDCGCQSDYPDLSKQKVFK